MPEQDMQTIKQKVKFLLCLCVALVSTVSQSQTTVAGSTPGQFAVSQTGAATYRIPIQVPPGVAGMEPKLELVYNSQSGNGLLGMGWALAGLSSITRCPQTPAVDGARGTVGLNNADRFCMDGQRLLLTVGAAYGNAATEYRTERESFAKITAIGGDNSTTASYSGPSSFTVKTKAGLTLDFGSTGDARVQVSGKAAILTWALNRITDTKGNYMTVSYTPDTANGSSTPLRIDYTGNTSTGTQPNLSVQFTPASRTDTRPFYVGGVLIKSTQRIANIQTYTGSTLVKDYQLTYLADAAVRNSTLASIKECQGTNCLMPTVFEHTTAGNTLAQSAMVSGVINWGTQGRWIDVNNDGKIDYCATVFNTIQCLLSSGTGFGSTTIVPPVYTILSFDGAMGPDLNGDGFPDFCATEVTGTPDTSKYSGIQSTNSICGLLDGAGGILGNAAPLARGLWSYDFWVDFDGDGRDDHCGLIGTVGGKNAIVPLTWSGTCLLATGVTVPFGAATDPFYGVSAIKWVDVNGDGLSDYCEITANGAPKCTLSTGSGMGATLTGAPLPGYSPQAASDWVDINGDGKIDFCWLVSGTVQCTLNTGTGFAGSVTSGTIDLGKAGTQVWVDVDGDGRADFCRELASNQIACNLSTGDGFGPTLVSPAITLGSEPKKWVDVNGDGYLDYCRNVGGTVNCAISKFMDSRIDKVTEGTGSNTSIVYQSIAEVSPAPIYTKDATGPYPMVSKQIPVYVVASSARSDGMGGSVATNYTYGGLKAEIGPGRGLLGFRWISAKNAVTNIENYSEYRQDWPYVGMLLKSETRLPGAGNAGVLKRTTLSSACQVPQTGAACTVAAGNRYFAYVASSLEESWDLNQTAYPSVTTNYAYGQNPQYGDPTQITVNISDGSSKTTDNEYYPADTTNWILGRLKKASVTSVQP